MYTIVAADIGGTNCRLGLFGYDNGQLSLNRSMWIQTKGVEHTDDFVKAVETALEISLEISDAMVAAIAGPVENNVRGRLTNSDMTLDFSGLMGRNNMRAMLINDFMAQAYAVISPEGKKALLLTGPENAPEEATRAVIGAGTGLGQAIIVRTFGLPHHSRWQPLPSENGHSVFPFIGPEEDKFHAFICRELNIPFATGDDVVTGRGLAALHKFLTGVSLTPPEVGQTALGGETETLAWYSRFYGRACRNWMLSTVCHGGLWIAGGIAAQNPYVVRNEHFMNELHGHPRWVEFLQSVPVYLIEDKNSGLWGSARLGQELLFLGGAEQSL